VEDILEADRDAREVAAVAVFRRREIAWTKGAMPAARPW
jgi:hypothetical protein